MSTNISNTSFTRYQYLYIFRYIIMKSEGSNILLDLVYHYHYSGLHSLGTI